MVRAGFAGRAEAAGLAGLDGDAVAGRHAGYEGADGVDGAGGFVAHGDATSVVDHAGDAAVAVEVDLGT